MNYNSFTPEMQSYFDSLPSVLRESISKSGKSFDSIDELRSFADELKREHKGKGGCGCGC